MGWQHIFQIYPIMEYASAYFAPEPQKWVTINIWFWLPVSTLRLHNGGAAIQKTLENWCMHAGLRV